MPKARGIRLEMGRRGRTVTFLVIVLSTMIATQSVAQAAARFPTEADVTSQVNINEIAIGDLVICGRTGAAAELLTLTLQLPKLLGKELDERKYRANIAAATQLAKLAGGRSPEDCIRDVHQADLVELLTFRMLYRLAPRSE